MKEEIRLFLKNLAEELRTQDNAATANPIYIVQDEIRIWGDFSGGGTGILYVWKDDPEYWWHDYEEALAELQNSGYTEDNFEDKIEEQEYIDEYVYITAHLTKKAAELYIEQNRHRMHNPRIYVDSQYRCHEFNILIDIIKNNF
jgi:hypothetical protein